ncbi:DUF5340 domain-containing protein [Chroococcidiopsis sp. FACHB-1243]|uniref:DUF5340 domain-containing protein n=1 Tax=Chroococcidiopsis sp. [FACHB-1243] TaxID=2692781 RepID=UPI00177C04E9|nr:DUF5340 domain-containing protein [Chroococcidiopsis sp. [FACHB-1243]]MBD2305853.1 DUF5340 domain-containing protein [Chroococcidiopsis sp. [FACHB-1243]]
MIPLPSPIHYEAVLQLLEQQTLPIVRQDPLLSEQVQQLIISLRKAAAQQKQLEASCQQAHVDYEFRWSINQSKSDLATTEHSTIS